MDFTVCKRALYGNGLQTWASAKFAETRDGTRMIIRLGVREWLVDVLAVEMTILALAVGLVAGCYLLPGVQCDRQPAVFFALPFLAWGSLMFGRWLARDQADFLLAFLKHRLEAEEVFKIPTSSADL
jgi:hypothetical protein